MNVVTLAGGEGYADVQAAVTGGFKPSEQRTGMLDDNIVTVS